MLEHGLDVYISFGWRFNVCSTALLCCTSQVSFCSLLVRDLRDRSVHRARQERKALLARMGLQDLKAIRATPEPLERPEHLELLERPEPLERPEHPEHLEPLERPEPLERRVLAFLGPFSRIGSL